MRHCIFDQCHTYIFFELNEAKHKLRKLSIMFQDIKLANTENSTILELLLTVHSMPLYIRNARISFKHRNVRY